MTFICSCDLYDLAVGNGGEASGIIVKISNDSDQYGLDGYFISHNTSEEKITGKFIFDETLPYNSSVFEGQYITIDFCEISSMNYTQDWDIYLREGQNNN